MTLLGKAVIGIAALWIASTGVYIYFAAFAGHGPDDVLWRLAQISAYVTAASALLLAGAKWFLRRGPEGLWAAVVLLGGHAVIIGALSSVGLFWASLLGFVATSFFACKILLPEDSSRLPNGEGRTISGTASLALAHLAGAAPLLYLTCGEGDGNWTDAFGVLAASVALLLIAGYLVLSVSWSMAYSRCSNRERKGHRIEAG